ncbi:serine/threonine/tyrosine-interacting-like protein 1 [Spea bombifrons]|uniref:serine/threonine/tyrosine-interacting-like protein 1 n=1 Tax=Spea bombifrons TaxID=233779 RepID=UPI00234BE3FB|nr:serine/threonine/tyrosine-interacting-like protein 1 [Spea bombifrons]
MSGLALCSETELYNILNQATKISRLAEPNYLCLLDARSKREYNEGHIITARRAKKDENDECFLLPESLELDCVKYCVVYDGHTDSLDGEGPAIECAKLMAEVCRHPVMVLAGGYENFSARYHFFRSQKVFWMPQEIDDFKPHPIEIMPSLLYLGDIRQASDRYILKDLKIKSQVNVSPEPVNVSLENVHVLHIPVTDTADSDLLQSFPSVCAFIDAHMGPNCAVLVFSKLGISSSSAVVIAYLMHCKKCSLKEAWAHVLKCKANMRPNRGFVEQLLEWEKTILGQAATDISDPKF